jgi:hypothetical protein
VSQIGHRRSLFGSLPCSVCIHYLVSSDPSFRIIDSPFSYEAQLVRERREREAGLPQSTGRGGVGNIARSRSRSRGPVPDGEDFHHHNSSLHSTGKGGLGNMYSVGESKEELAKLRALDEEDEAVRRSYERRHADDPVFSGKGPSQCSLFVTAGFASLKTDSARNIQAERETSMFPIMPRLPSSRTVCRRFPSTRTRQQLLPSARYSPNRTMGGPRVRLCLLHSSSSHG